MFDRFYRGHASRDSKTDGLGLGLSFRKEAGSVFADLEIKQDPVSNNNHLLAYLHCTPFSPEVSHNNTKILCYPQCVLPLVGLLPIL